MVGICHGGNVPVSHDDDDDDDDLTRSKASGKEVVISRVPANRRDLQFLIYNKNVNVSDFLWLISCR